MKKKHYTKQILFLLSYILLSVSLMGQSTLFSNVSAQENSTYSALKAPQEAIKKELRLQISNGVTHDQTLLIFCEDATEDWNSSKLMNPGLNIYTLKDGRELALNSNKVINYEAEIPVGVKAAKGAYTFSAFNYLNFGTDKVFLNDKITGTYTDLSTSAYTVNFSVDYDGTNRFVLIVKNDVTTGSTPTFSGTGNWSNPNNWQGKVIPEGTTAHVTVIGAATIDQNTTIGNLTIKSGATLLPVGTYQLTVNGSTTVEQSVQKPQTYYIGSPTCGLVTTSNIGKAITFEENTDKWSILETFPIAPVPGKGYGIQVGKKDDPAETVTISFTGTLNDDPSIDITSTTNKRRFNFLGNPYPSYLDGAAMVVADSRLEKTIWLYAKEGGEYNFKFRNVAVPGGEGTLADAYIPPMQGFWVRIVSTMPSDTYSYAFNNNMRRHRGASTTVFRAPENSEKKVMYLQISNGTQNDEAIILFSENANQDWNSSKLTNPRLNIYTVKAGADLSLNSSTAIEYDVETPVGVKAESGAYTFSASKFENFGTAKAYLLDKVAKVATDLSSSDYTVNFTESYEGTDRFALIFPRSGVISGLENAEATSFFAFAHNNRISVNSDAQAGMIYVFNSIGQQVAAQPVSENLTTVNTTLPAGVYVVKLNNLTTKVAVK